MVVIKPSPPHIKVDMEAIKVDEVAMGATKVEEVAMGATKVDEVAMTSKPIIHHRTVDMVANNPHPEEINMASSSSKEDMDNNLI